MASLDLRLNHYFPEDIERTDWNGLSTFLSDLNVGVTTWGDRFVTNNLRIEGVIDTIALSALISKVHAVAKQACILDCLSKEDRLSALHVIDQIQNFYERGSAASARRPFYQRWISGCVSCFQFDDSHFLLYRRLGELVCSYSEETFKSSFKSTTLSTGSYWLDDHMPRYVASREMIRNSMPLLTV